jgi:hypothetical protein
VQFFVSLFQQLVLNQLRAYPLFAVKVTVFPPMVILLRFLDIDAPEYSDMDQGSAVHQ